MSEEQRLSTNSLNTNEPAEQNQAPVAETSELVQVQVRKSLRLDLRNKRDLDDFTPNFACGENTRRPENVKRIKKTSTNTERVLSGEEGKDLVEHPVFSNDLVLSIIFKTLTYKDLVSIRQVNRLWNLEATKLMLKYNYGEVQISDDTAKLLLFYKNKRTVALQEFQNLVKNSMMFPYCRFAVHDDPLSDNIKDFFIINGHHVKSFVFSSRQNRDEELKASAYDFVLLAATHFPNLETLRFESYKFPLPPSSEKEEIPSPLQTEIVEAIRCAPEMERLHTLALKCTLPSQLLSLILLKAKNLKMDLAYGRDYKSGLENLLEVPGAILRLKNFCFMFSPELLDTFEKVLLENPRFSRIDAVCACTCMFPTLDLTKVGQLLSGFFQQCSESLTEILDLRFLGHIPRLTIPVFPNVKRLEFSYLPGSRNMPPPMLPLGVNLADKFPNVKTVEFKFCASFNKRGPEQILPHDLLGPFLSVRHLQINLGPGFVSDEWVEKFCLLFPNLKSVKCYYKISDRALEHMQRRGIRKWI